MYREIPIDDTKALIALYGAFAELVEKDAAILNNARNTVIAKNGETQGVLQAPEHWYDFEIKIRVRLDNTRLTRALSLVSERAGAPAIIQGLNDADSC